MKQEKEAGRELTLKADSREDLIWAFLFIVRKMRPKGFKGLTPGHLDRNRKKTGFLPTYVSQICLILNPR